ncbi:MAG: M91 family zinc metallopeptidase [Acidobacteriota bacterium]
MRVQAQSTRSINTAPITPVPHKVDLRSAVMHSSPSTPVSFGRLNELQALGQNLKVRLAQAVGRSAVGQPSALTASNSFSREATVTRVNGQVIIDTGDGNDQIRVTQDARTGDVTVSVNGESRTFTGNDRNNLVIRAGAGNDVIQVDPGVTVNLRLYGGDGDDVINGGSGHDRIDSGAGRDRIYGGAGNDYIYGGDGNDTLQGGGGNDTVYGGAGNDLVYGSAGDDYLEGGKGNDTIYGGAGNDVVSGGEGNDRLFGDTGNDAIYAGQGKDNISGGSGNNKLYVQADDTVQATPRGASNQSVTVELTGNPGGLGVIVRGSDAFRQRVMDDLDMLRSSPVGRQMLASFDAAHQRDGVTVTIEEITEDNGFASRSRFSNPFLDPATGRRGTPTNATIGYNPTFAPTFGFVDGTDAYTPPAVVLYHEMAHAYDYTHGTLRPGTYQGVDTADRGRVPNLERVAVGVPLDHDNNPQTPEQLDNANHPRALTENGIREEMMLQLRRSYALARLSGF